MKAGSKFEISGFDRAVLALGACAGFVLALYASQSLWFSFLVGIPMGIGGNCVVLILARLLWPNGIEHPHFFIFDRKRRYLTVTVILLSAAWSYWEAASRHDTFGLLCLSIFYSQFAVLFGYSWYRHMRGA
jgi:hypothetical protein